MIGAELAILPKPSIHAEDTAVPNKRKISLGRIHNSRILITKSKTPSHCKTSSKIPSQVDAATRNQIGPLFAPQRYFRRLHVVRGMGIALRQTDRLPPHIHHKVTNQCQGKVHTSPYRLYQGRKFHFVLPLSPRPATAAHRKTTLTDTSTSKTKRQGMIA